MNNLFASDWLQSAINAALALDPEMSEKLASMSGRVIRIHLKLIERDLYLLPDADGIEVRAQYETEVDTTISGTPLALLKMGLSQQTAPLLLKGEVSIEGNTQLGREFKKVLASLDIDWEELAARMIGDAPAHHVFKTLNTIHRWGRQSLRSLSDDVSEYLQEESRDVVSGAELNHFNQQVDELRDAVARIEQQLAKLDGADKK